MSLQNHDSKLIATRQRVTVAASLLLLLLLSPVVASADGGFNNMPAFLFLALLASPVIFLVLHLNVIAVFDKNRENQERVSNDQTLRKHVPLIFLDLILAILSAVLIIYLHLYVILALSGTLYAVPIVLMVISAIGYLFTKNPIRKKRWLHNLLFVVLTATFVTGYFMGINPILDATNCSVNISVLSEEEERVKSLANECLYRRIDPDVTSKAIEEGYSSATLTPCDTLPNPQSNGPREGTAGYCRMKIISKLFLNEDKRLCTLPDPNIHAYAGYEDVCGEIVR
jgi:hypothetical protein